MASERWVHMAQLITPFPSKKPSRIIHVPDMAVVSQHPKYTLETEKQKLQSFLRAHWYIDVSVHAFYAEILLSPFVHVLHFRTHECPIPFEARIFIMP